MCLLHCPAGLGRRGRRVDDLEVHVQGAQQPLLIHINIAWPRGGDITKHEHHRDAGGLQLCQGRERVGETRSVRRGSDGDLAGCTEIGIRSGNRATFVACGSVPVNRRGEGADQVNVAITDYAEHVGAHHPQLISDRLGHRSLWMLEFHYWLRSPSS